MAIHNFSGVEEPRDFRPIPAGQYPLRVVKVESGFNDKGIKTWKVVFVVTEGRGAGKAITDYLRWDSSSKISFGRLLQILRCLKVDTSAPDDDYPEILIGRECYGPVVEDEFEVTRGPRAGQMQKGNKLGIAGFEPREVWLQPYIPVPPRDPQGMSAPQAPAADPFSTDAPW